MDATRPTQKPKSRCYDCKRVVLRETTRRVFRTNTQGKSASVRVCAANCPKERS